MSTGRFLVRAGERGPEGEFRHPYNPASEIHGVMLSRLCGLTRIGVSLARVPPGKESFVFHLHHTEEEWMFVISGRGTAEIDDQAFEVASGDFLGFSPGTAHHLRNTGPDDLVYLSGGENLATEVADFPRLGRRAVRFGGGAGSPGTMAVYPLDAEVPLFPRK